jgi:RNA polymerase sigma-70 factor (ECF subfamily)
VQDKELVNRVLRGETHVFATIIKNTEGLVAQIVFKLITNAEDRKDIAQDIYLKAFKSLSGFKYQSKLSTWIGKIAYNTCFNFLEKKQLVLLDNTIPENEKQESALEFFINKFVGLSDNNSETTLIRTERLEIVQSAIEKLPPLFKTLIMLYHYEELSYEEIAEITSLPIGTVKSYLFRSRKSLKDNILLKYKEEEI